MNEKELEELAEAKYPSNIDVHFISGHKIDLNLEVRQPAFIVGYKAKEEEAVDFAEWISNNQFTQYNNFWKSTKIHYSGIEYSTKQLYELYKEYLTQKQKV